MAHLTTWGSHPRWLVERWVARYGADGARRLTEANNSRPQLYLRALGEDVPGIVAALARAGVETEPFDLLPRALVKPYRLDGYLDLRRGLLVVDTASRKAAEGFVSNLRHTLGSFPALPLNAEVQDAAPDFKDAAALRERFEGRWVVWNIARTITATGGLVALCVALFTAGRASA
mgnify:CR=1 FL=1